MLRLQGSLLEKDREIEALKKSLDEETVRADEKESELKTANEEIERLKEMLKDAKARFDEIAYQCDRILRDLNMEAL